jgi:hypothetical protein
VCLCVCVWGCVDASRVYPFHPAAMTPCRDVWSWDDDLNDLHTIQQATSIIWGLEC